MPDNNKIQTAERERNTLAFGLQKIHEAEQRNKSPELNAHKPREHAINSM